MILYTLFRNSSEINIMSSIIEPRKSRIPQSDADYGIVKESESGGRNRSSTRGKAAGRATADSAEENDTYNDDDEDNDDDDDDDEEIYDL